MGDLLNLSATPGNDAPRERLLVIDGDPVDLRILAEYLEEEDYELDLVSSAEVAWRKLDQPDQPYTLVILDHFLCRDPETSLLHRIRQHKTLCHLPVILQISAADPEQIRRGFEEGARYYLTKPYQPESMLAIVRAAIADRIHQDQRRAQVQHGEGVLALLRQAEYRFATLEDVNILVPVLAGLCPEPEKVVNGLSELMVNAVEHGNLGISYQEKALLRWEDDWEAEILRRQAMPEYREKYATVQVRRGAESIVFTITDQGQGFDWTRYMDFDAERACDPNGRGIAMARLMSFSALAYQAPGNVVVATVRLEPVSG